MNKITRIAIILTATAILVFGWYQAIAFTKLTSSVAFKTEEQKLQHKQDLWISALELCESSGNPDVVVLDINNEYSYGAFQFQKNTFYQYGMKYGLLEKDFPLEETANIITDYSLQRKIAERMLEDGLANHWFNCKTKIGKAFPVK